MAKTKSKTAITSTSVSLVADTPVPFIGGTYKTGLSMYFSRMTCGQVMLTMFVCDENGSVEDIEEITLTESATRQFDTIPVLAGDQIKVRIQPNWGFSVCNPVGIAVERVPGAEIGVPFVKLQATDLVEHVETLIATDAVLSSLKLPSAQLVSEVSSYLILRGVITTNDIEGLAWSRKMECREQDSIN